MKIQEMFKYIEEVMPRLQISLDSAIQRRDFTKCAQVQQAMEVSKLFFCRSIC